MATTKKKAQEPEYEIVKADDNTDSINDLASIIEAEIASLQCKKITTTGEPLPNWIATVLTLLPHSDIRQACKTAGVSHVRYYDALKKYPELQVLHDKIFKDTIARKTSELEGALFKRALSHDTIAAFFLLKSYDPQRFQDKYIMNFEAGDQAVNINISSPKTDKKKKE